jgi:hypothetical protein
MYLLIGAPFVHSFFQQYVAIGKLAKLGGPWLRVFNFLADKRIEK